MNFFSRIMEYSQYLESAMIFLGYLTASCTVLVRMKPLEKLAKPILSAIGLWNKASSFLSKVPTLGIHPRTEKLMKALDEAKAELALIKIVEEKTDK